MKCPGQDKAYWKGERVFEMPCPKCGAAVEFFRDENARRCSQCGYRFNNARVALNCAEWCDQAEMCLGISRPQRGALGDGETALAGRMIQALEEAIPNDSQRFAQALLVFQHAKDLVPATGVNPRAVLPASLLLEIEKRGDTESVPNGGQLPDAPAAGPSVAAILAHAGLDEETIQLVSALIANYHSHRQADTMEAAVLRDACRLAGLVQEGGIGDPELLESVIAREFQTEAGKARARELFVH